MQLLLNKKNHISGQKKTSPSLHTYLFVQKYVNLQNNALDKIH